MELLLMFWALSVKLLKTTDFSRIKLGLGSELRWNKILQKIRYMAFCSFGVKVGVTTAEAGECPALI